ncbi:MAG: response regulator, partial [Novibacillus thermophilus]
MNVLLVEDERTIRQGLRDLLENVIGGVSVSWEAQNGKEALHILKKEVPDLLITDVRMPEMNGLDLIN